VEAGFRGILDDIEYMSFYLILFFFFIEFSVINILFFNTKSEELLSLKINLNYISLIT